LQAEIFYLYPDSLSNVFPHNLYQMDGKCKFLDDGELKNFSESRLDCPVEHNEMSGLEILKTRLRQVSE